MEDYDEAFEEFYDAFFTLLQRTDNGLPYPTANANDPHQVFRFVAALLKAIYPQSPELFAINDPARALAEFKGTPVMSETATVYVYQKCRWLLPLDARALARPYDLARLLWNEIINTDVVWPELHPRMARRVNDGTFSTPNKRRRLLVEAEASVLAKEAVDGLQRVLIGDVRDYIYTMLTDAEIRTMRRVSTQYAAELRVESFMRAVWMREALLSVLWYVDQPATLVPPLSTLFDALFKKYQPLEAGEEPPRYEVRPLASAQLKQLMRELCRELGRLMAAQTVSALYAMADRDAKATREQERQHIELLNSDGAIFAMYRGYDDHHGYELHLMQNVPRPLQPLVNDASKALSDRRTWPLLLEQRLAALYSAFLFYPSEEWARRIETAVQAGETDPDVLREKLADRDDTAWTLGSLQLEGKMPHDQTHVDTWAISLATHGKVVNLSTPPPASE